MDWCEFNAIVVIPLAGFAEVNTSLCHSCGACSVACGYEAISEKPEEIGIIRHYSIGQHGIISEGRLKIGSAMQTLLIKQVKQQVLDDVDIIIFDAPPGTSCPVVETVADADYIILVTEPTPFGLNDLELAVGVARQLEIPCGILINRSDSGDDQVKEYCRREALPILMEIPFDRDLAFAYSKGEAAVIKSTSLREDFLKLHQKIVAEVEK